MSALLAIAGTTAGCFALRAAFAAGADGTVREGTRDVLLAVATVAGLAAVFLAYAAGRAA